MQGRCWEFAFAATCFCSDGETSGRILSAGSRMIRLFRACRTKVDSKSLREIEHPDSLEDSRSWFPMRPYTHRWCRDTGA